MTDGDDQHPTSQWGSPASLAPSERPRSLPPELPEYIALDIVSTVQKSLAKFGIPGTVRWEGLQLVLVEAAHPSAAVPVGSWAADWTRMDEASRRLRAEDVARTFNRHRRQRLSSAPAARRIYVDPKLVVLIGILCAAVAWVYFGSDDLPVSRAGTGAVETAHEADAVGQASRIARDPSNGAGDARASRVCSATLTRIFQGGSVSVADVDGFRVEIALLRVGSSAALADAPELDLFVEDHRSATGSRFIWGPEKDLATVETSDSVVVVRSMPFDGDGERISGVVLSFGGSLVDPYFKEEQRNRYFHIAHALSQRLGATHTAVYARCFDQPLHALGSWFRGEDTGGAIAALVYFMGTYARPLHLAKPFTHPPGEDRLNREHAFRSIVDKTKDMTRTELASIVGHEGGMATGKDGDQVLITFPFGDGNRASRASRSVVRATGLGY